MTFVNESGLYELIFRSKDPNAKAFKKWIKTDVIPSIRKTGEYKLNKTENYYDVKINSLLIDNNIKLYDFFKNENDERLMSICRDNLNNIAVSNNQTKMIEDKTKLVSISERIYNYMKKKPNKEEHNKLIKLGKLIKIGYTKRHASEPLKCMKFCNGQNVEVNCYDLNEYETWIDEFIKSYYEW